MAKETKTSPTTLSVMLGSGETFEVKGKKYTVNPIPIAHIEEFIKTPVPFVENATLTLASEESFRKGADKWLGEVTVELSGGQKVSTTYCKNENGETMSYEKIKIDGWTGKDIKEYFKFLITISG